MSFFYLDNCILICIFCVTIYNNYVEKNEYVKRTAGFLAVVGVLSKVLGALYRVPLTNVLGAEGMGIYQTVFPLYAFLVALCGGGMTTAVSHVVAKYNVTNQKTCVQTVRAAILPITVFSLVITIFATACCKPLSRLQGNSDVALCYATLFPSLLFTGSISVFRGYFLGRLRPLHNGISQLIEQVVKLILGLSFSKFLLPNGAEVAVVGAVLGVTVGEVLTFLYLLCAYVVFNKRKGFDKNSVQSVSDNANESADAVENFQTERVVYENGMGIASSINNDTCEVADEHLGVRVNDVIEQNISQKNRKIGNRFTSVLTAIFTNALSKELYSFAVPIALSSMILPIAQLIDSFTIVNILVKNGVERSFATSLYGVLCGPISTLLAAPNIFTTAILTSYMPIITAQIERGENNSEKIVKMTEIIMVLTFAIATIFFIFPNDIIEALYSGGLSSEELSVGAKLLKLQAISIFYGGLSQCVITVTQACGKPFLSVVGVGIGAVAKALLTPILTHFFGIAGAGVANVFYYAVSATLGARWLGVVKEITIDKTRLAVATIFSAMSAVGFFCGKKVGELTFGSSFLITVVGGVGVLLVCLLFLVCVRVCERYKKNR